MEGREGMASYYMQRGLGGSAIMPSPPGFQPLSGQPVQSNYGGNSSGLTLPSESQAAGATPSGEPMKRKRGRPRKYGPDGTISAPLSPKRPVSQASQSNLSVHKRGRGRPPGSGSKQQLASLGHWLLGSAGMNFTPHILSIAVGEDIASKIMSFSQQGSRAVCILSASGSVSTATLRQPASSGGIVTYEGWFEILSFSGSYLLTDNSGSRNRSGALSVSLSSPDGRVVGGGVGGMLIAATPVQVIAGSFIFSATKLKNKSEVGPESSIEYDHPSGDDNLVSPGSGLAVQNPSGNRSGWPSSRSTDMRNTMTDLDLTRG